MLKHEIMGIGQQFANWKAHSHHAIDHEIRYWENFSNLPEKRFRASFQNRAMCVIKRIP